jgi:hypothetical protein
MLEREIEKYLVKRVKELGGEAYKFTSPSHRGVSDRVVCLPGGETWFVELKTQGGKLSRLQDMFQKDMARLGQNYACLWSKEQVDHWLLDRTKKTPPTSCSNMTAP